MTLSGLGRMKSVLEKDMETAMLRTHNLAGISDLQVLVRYMVTMPHSCFVSGLACHLIDAVFRICLSFDCCCLPHIPCFAAACPTWLLLTRLPACATQYHSQIDGPCDIFLLQKTRNLDQGAGFALAGSVITTGAIKTFLTTMLSVMSFIFTKSLAKKGERDIVSGSDSV